MGLGGTPENWELAGENPPKSLFLLLLVEAPSCSVVFKALTLGFLLLPPLMVIPLPTAPSQLQEAWPARTWCRCAARTLLPVFSPLFGGNVLLFNTLGWLECFWGKPAASSSLKCGKGSSQVLRVVGTGEKHPQIQRPNCRGTPGAGAGQGAGSDWEEEEDGGRGFLGSGKKDPSPSWSGVVGHGTATATTERWEASPRSPQGFAHG